MPTTGTNCILRVAALCSRGRELTKIETKKRNNDKLYGISSRCLSSRDAKHTQFTHSVTVKNVYASFPQLFAF